MAMEHDIESGRLIFDVLLLLIYKSHAIWPLTQQPPLSSVVVVLLVLDLVLVSSLADVVLVVVLLLLLLLAHVCIYI